MQARVKLLAGVAFITSLFLIVPVQALLRQGTQSGGDLPEGKGRESVAAVCVQCHALSTVTSQRRNRKEWEEAVARMVSNGAQISADENQAIVAYLTQHFGPESKGPAAGAGAPSGGEGGSRAEAGGGFPDGPGKEVLMAKCFQCHGETMWKDQRQERKKWEGTLYRMVGKGALWTEEEIAAMAQYLATAFGPKGETAGSKTQR